MRGRVCHSVAWGRGRKRPTRAPRSACPTGKTHANDPGAARASASEVAKAAIDVSDAWTRATPGQATSAAVYLHVANAGKEADTLTGVESPNAQHAMVHTTTMANGTATMNMTPSVSIPARSTVTLAPNGQHIMLEGLKAPMHEGESFIITLTFAKAGKVSATVKVMAVSSNGPS